MSSAKTPPSAAPGALNDVDWLSVAAQHDVDPYVLWALETEFRDFDSTRTALPAVLNLIAELKKPLEQAGSEDFFALLNLGRELDPIKGYIPKAFFTPYPGKNSTRTKFVSFRLNVAAPPNSLSSIGKKLEALITNKHIQRVKLGYPRGTKIDKEYGRYPIPPTMSKNKRPVLLAAIDNTCPFFNHSLRKDAGSPGTRVAVLWDQTSLAPSTAPQAPNLFPYGQQWLRNQLDTFAKPLLDDEERLSDEWERIGVEKGRFASTRGRASHGAAVLGLLAAPNVVAGLPLDGVLPGEGDAPVKEATDSDNLAACPLGVVQLPREQSQISSGRWLEPNVIDGLWYLMHWGWSHEQGNSPPPPLVVNISYGAQAGPHDGTGILETAMKEMCDNYGGELAIVLAAGNSHGTQRDAEDDLKYVPSGTHAQAQLTLAKKAKFHFFLPPDKQSTSELEIWFNRKLTEKDEISIRVSYPGQTTPEASFSIDFPGCAWLRDKNDEVIAGLIGLRRVPQASNKSMALVMMAATQLSSTRVEAPAGVWTVEIEGKQLASEPLNIDLWVERDTTVVGAVRDQQARLLMNESGSSPLTDRDTFTNIATGDKTFVATSVQKLASVHPATMAQASTYSSEGTDLRMPDLSALVDPLRTAHGMRVKGNRTGVVVRANGTSMAAPQAARWIADRLAGGDSLAQIHAAIAADPNRTTRVGKVVP